MGVSLYLAKAGQDEMTHVGELADADCRAAELFLGNELSWPMVIDRTGDFVITNEHCRTLTDRVHARRASIEQRGISLEHGGLAVLVGGLQSAAESGRDLRGFGD